MIAGNYIEFYSRFRGLVFSETSIGEDGQYKYAFNRSAISYFKMNLETLEFMQNVVLK